MEIVGGKGGSSSQSQMTWLVSALAELENDGRKLGIEGCFMLQVVAILEEKKIVD